MHHKARVFAAMLSLAGSLVARGASADEPPRWAGSEISIEHYANVISFDRSAELSYDPIFLQVIRLEPKWRLNEHFSLGAHLGVETELTDSDDTTRLRQPLLDDAYLGVAYKPPLLLGGIKTGLSLRLTLPTSMESRARERIIAFGPGLTVSRSFRLGSAVELTPLLTFGANFWAASARSLTYDAPTISACQLGGNCAAFDHSGVRSTQYSLAESIGLKAAFPHDFTGTVLVGWNQGKLYPLDTALNPVDGMPLGTDGNDTDWRYLMQYVLEASWTGIPHVELATGVQTVSPMRAPDSSLYAPFFNRYTQVFLRVAYAF